MLPRIRKVLHIERLLMKRINWEMIGALVGIISLVITIVLAWGELGHFIDWQLLVVLIAIVGLVLVIVTGWVIVGALRSRSARSKEVTETVGISPLLKEVGFEGIRPMNYEEYYSKEEFLTVSSHPESPIYHVELFRNSKGLDRSRFKFEYGGDFHIAHPIFAQLEVEVADRLKYNETRLRVAKINLKPSLFLSQPSLEIHCQKATYSQVLVTNHSDELVFDGEILRDVFAPSVDGRLPPLEDSLAANPAGCNCLLETSDNYFVIQRRSDKVETSRLLYTSAVSGGTEYSRPHPQGNLDPFSQLLSEMAEEIGLGRDSLMCDPMLLAISRDVQRNGLPEFFFYARLQIGFDEVERGMMRIKPRDAWEHRGIFPLRAEETDVLDYVMSQESSVALRANLAYYLELIDVVREWCTKGGNVSHRAQNASEK
jgi:hypothetical protein